MTDLAAILDSSTRVENDPIVRWTCLSLRKIAAELVQKGHKMYSRKVKRLLMDLGYNLQSNRKIDNEKQHEDRNDQFMFINDQLKNALKNNQPVISVNTIKKELVGDPVKVNVSDSLDLSVPKAIPYGIYDIGCQTGLVNVSAALDTSSFAAASIRGWWKNIGRKSYPSPHYVLITADGGGSNEYKLNLWKYELQKLANELRVPIRVCLFPPGASQWDKKVERKLFSFISTNWQGQPLQDYETVVNLISHTYAVKGLKAICKLDRRNFKEGLNVTKERKQPICLEKSKFHGEWNYTIYNWNS
jgi:hypothetical protein